MERTYDTLGESAKLAAVQPCAALDPPWEFEILSRTRVRRRWGHGSDSTLWRLEADGLLVPRRYGGRLGYTWRDLWDYEGGQPPDGMDAAYREDLVGPEAIAALCPLSAAAILARAKRGEIPSRRIGRFVKFVPEEARRWLRQWR
ncbi:hypothetical protein SAMN05444722_0418 [Rhodovulum sp. ES.010]|uniref:hypothetical protein n=1 Tax=Rhodovulum sp. ES.010 TaxID=1882821 RepID=UPI00092B1A21|nr:hypothetical protein [Rhodovulum sp. ES.010]SIO10071.1 hypothetical protein SAMN05444722_0418 [Rhodovulum sp. ES.010]